jgi:hypothetical protein
MRLSCLLIIGSCLMACGTTQQTPGGSGDAGPASGMDAGHDQQAGSHAASGGHGGNQAGANAGHAANGGAGQLGGAGNGNPTGGNSGHSGPNGGGQSGGQSGPPRAHVMFQLKGVK